MLMGVRPLLVVALSIGFGACSTSKPTSTPTTISSSPRATPNPTSTPTAQSPSERRYLQILGPADTATGAFFTALKALPSAATGTDAQRIATPAADAIAAADVQLVAAIWPTKVATDIKALVRADERLVGDLRDLAQQPHPSTGPWKTRFENDVASVGQAAGITRTDLINSPK